MNARLRDRRLTPKPRIVVSAHGFFNVDRLNPSTPGSEVHVADTYAEAVEKALEWAGPKEVA